MLLQEQSVLMSDLCSWCF